MIMNTLKPVDTKQEQTMHTAGTSAMSFIGILLIASCLGLSGCTKSAGHSNQLSFASPQDAAGAFAKAVCEDNKEQMLKILGADGNDLIWSGDEVRDQQSRDRFEKAYDEQHRIDTEGNKEILVIGKNDWPFPIPIIQENKKWIFDTASGKEEILNRRIGRNELDTIQTMLAFVDAEREYAMTNKDANGTGQYARKFKSDAGTRNGLYWEAKEGEEQSPLGPLVASARQEGYSTKMSSEGRLPYHGYFYRILTAQGEHAQGGAYNYIVNGKMIGGFAAVAYPAEYGNSGVMTFIVNYEGVVYQKDLGSNTEKEARAMERFDPDETWKKVQ
jgi:hypothetical protein